jgi:hypothetical protein
MTLLMRRTMRRSGADEKLVQRRSSFACLVLSAVLLFGAVPAAQAITLDTPALLDLTSSGAFVCNVTNLDAAKTATLNASGTSGLIQDDGTVVANFPSPLSIPPGQTATTIRTSCVRSASTLVHAPACRCHFEVTGVSRAKIRAALSTDAAGSVAAD